MERKKENIDNKINLNNSIDRKNFGILKFGRYKTCTVFGIAFKLCYRFLNFCYFHPFFCYLIYST